MDEQSDLADVVATILAFHVSELPQAVIPAKTVAQLNPDIRSAYLIRQKLEPYIESRRWLKDRVQALATEPSESTRQALSDELRHLFDREPEIRAESEEIARQSPYAVLLGLPGSTHPVEEGESPSSRSIRGGAMTQLLIWVMLIWAGSIFLTAMENLKGIVVLLIIRAALFGYYAKRLHIRQPFWLGVGAVIPTNALFLLVAMAGYRRIKHAPDDTQVYYTPLTKAVTVGIAVFLVVLPVLFSATNPDYMRQIFANEWGIALYLTAIFSYCLVLLAFGFGFWLDGAKSGPAMVLVSTVASWASFLVLWTTMLGPSFVRLIELYPETFGW